MRCGYAVCTYYPRCRQQIPSCPENTMDLEKTAHWNIHFTGDDADKVDIIGIIEELKLKVEVTSASVQVYYKPKVESSKT